MVALFHIQQLNLLGVLVLQIYNEGKVVTSKNIQFQKPNIVCAITCTG